MSFRRTQYPCPLCAGLEISILWEQQTNLNWNDYGLIASTERSLFFFRCEHCRLVFKDPAVFPTPAVEKARYASHQNSLDDVKYLNFLDRLAAPLAARLSEGSKGLDFGCGPSKALAHIFQQRGFLTESYDPIFHPDLGPLGRQYDFIACSEAAEHFHHPGNEFTRMFGLIKPGGWLGLMTQLVPQDFTTWWYHRDPTHVVFYSTPTLEWIARKYSARLHAYPHGVALFN